MHHLHFFVLISILCLGVNVGAAEEPAGAPSHAEACFACHGPQGNSAQDKYPVIAGQQLAYLYVQLKDYKEGRRSDPEMSPMATNLTKDDMLALATYFSREKRAPTGFRADPVLAAKGKAIADAALCTMCHMGQYQGQNEIPGLAGQRRGYLTKQLNDFRAHRRTNDAGNMVSVVGSLTDSEIDAIAEYLAGL